MKNNGGSQKSVPGKLSGRANVWACNLCWEDAILLKILVDFEMHQNKSRSKETEIAATLVVVAVQR